MARLVLFVIGGVFLAQASGYIYKRDNILQFSGASPWTTLPADVTVSGNAPRTVGMWAKTSASQMQTLFASGTVSIGQAFNLKIRVDGILFNGHGRESWANVPNAVDGLWHHYVVSYDGASIRLYFDGEEASRAELTLDTQGDNNFLGVSNQVGYEDPFVGEMKFIFVTGSALSNAAIYDLYAQPLIPTPALTPAPTPAPTTAPCSDTSGGATDIVMLSCDAYIESPQLCQSAFAHADSDFSPTDMCCGCGGGTTATEAPSPVPLTSRTTTTTIGLQTSTITATPAREPTLQPTPAPTAAPAYVLLLETSMCEAPGYTTTVTSVEECAILCDTQVAGCAFFSYTPGACKLTDSCDDVTASSEYTVYKIGEFGAGDMVNSTPGLDLRSICTLLCYLVLLACLQA